MNAEHFNIEGVAAEAAEREAKLAGISQALKDANPDRFNAYVQRIETVKGSKSAILCECGKWIEFHRFVFKGFNGVSELKPLPTQCSECRIRSLKIEWAEKHRRQFFEDNPGAGFYAENKGTPPNPEAYNAVMSWHPDKHPGGIVSIGDSFTGKTTALIHKVLNELSVDGRYHECRIVSAADLNDIPSMVIDRTVRAFVNELCTVEMLLLDDLDKTRITPRVASELWTIIERRLRAYELPTFITMNVRSRKDFIQMFSTKEREGSDPKQIGLSIYNRLVQSCMFIDFNA
jgi:hypothetical protein